jgi:hypothetical protein
VFDPSRTARLANSFLVAKINAVEATRTVCVPRRKRLHGHCGSLVKPAHRRVTSKPVEPSLRSSDAYPSKPSVLSNPLPTHSGRLGRFEFQRLQRSAVPPRSCRSSCPLCSSTCRAAWRDHYNHERPHSALDDRTHAVFAGLVPDQSASPSLILIRQTADRVKGSLRWLPPPLTRPAVCLKIPMIRAKRFSASLKPGILY